MGAYLIYSKKSQVHIDLFDTGQLTLNNISVLYGHKQEVFKIQSSKSLDVLISVDYEGFVMIH